MPGYRAKKRLGQNFLKSPAVVERIIELIDPRPTDLIVEVGPGRGALTLALAQSGARITAVEFDRDIVGYLRKLLEDHTGVTVLNEDFLAFDPGAHGLDRFKLIGNLPFNLSSPVLEWTTGHVDRIERAVFMLQKEVAGRLCSGPGSKDWSPLAIFTQLVFEAHRRFDVSPKHFSPPPKVTSSVVELVPRGKPRRAVTPLFEKVVRAAFARRRKQLVNNLVPEILPDPDSARAAIADAGFPPDVRAEQVSIDGFFNLTRCLEARYIQP